MTLEDYGDVRFAEGLRQGEEIGIAKEKLNTEKEKLKTENEKQRAESAEALLAKYIEQFGLLED